MAVLRNEREWKKVFNEMFNELNRRKLAPHASMLLDQEFTVYELQNRAVFKCNECNKKWISYRARMNFTYMLTKAGKPKKRFGKVTMIPFGQQCRECAKGKGDEEDKLFYMPLFEMVAIHETLIKVYEKVEAKYYLKKDAESAEFILRKKNELDSMVNHTRALRITNQQNQTHSYSGQRQHLFQPTFFAPPDMFLPTGPEGVQGPVTYMAPLQVPEQGSTTEGKTEDNDEEFEQVPIGSGPHMESLCEACAKGVCMIGRNRSRGTSEQASGRQSVKGGEKKYIEVPKKLFSDEAEDVNLRQKVKWHLYFKNLEL